MQKRNVLSALCAAFALCAASALAAMPDAEFAELCFEGSVEQVKQALAGGANPKARDEDHVPALVGAAARNNVAVIRALLDAGADVNVGDRGGYKALMAAASSNDVSVVQALLAAGAKVNARDNTDMSALMLAAARNHPEITALLLEAGADKTLKDAAGHDALWYAKNPDREVLKADTDACVKLLEGGAQKPAQAKPQEAAKAAAAAPAKTYKNSIGMEFVLIPAGTFQMGCEPPEAGKCEPHEGPRHTVTISKPFYLGKYEVTQAEWQAVMGSNPSKFKGANRPVENVTWPDAQEFVKKLNAKEGHKRYRLPTEAEWEYAARAGSTTAYSFGDDAGQLGNYAWHKGNSGEETHPVGQKQPNAWGLHDMHGNVDEWVHDWYGEYEGAGAVTTPLRSGEEDATGPDSAHVIRGGSWFHDAGRCRSTYRIWQYAEEGGNNIGLRLAITPQQ